MTPVTHSPIRSVRHYFILFPQAYGWPKGTRLLNGRGRLSEKLLDVVCGFIGSPEWSFVAHRFIAPTCRGNAKLKHFHSTCQGVMGSAISALKAPQAFKYTYLPGSFYGFTTSRTGLNNLALYRIQTRLPKCTTKVVFFLLLHYIRNNVPYNKGILYLLSRL